MEIIQLKSVENLQNLSSSKAFSDIIYLRLILRKIKKFVKKNSNIENALKYLISKLLNLIRRLIYEWAVCNILLMFLHYDHHQTNKNIGFSYELIWTGSDEKYISRMLHPKLNAKTFISTCSCLLQNFFRLPAYFSTFIYAALDWEIK